jgi:hypothetical protein
MGDKVIFCVIIKMPNNNTKKNNTAKNNKKNNTVNNNKKNNTVNNNKKNNTVKTVNNNKKNNVANNNKKNNTVNNNKKNNNANKANNKKNNNANKANNNKKNNNANNNTKKNNNANNNTKKNNNANNDSINEAVQHCRHSLPFIRDKAKNLGNNDPDASYWKASLNFLEEHCPIIEKHENTNSSKNYVKRVNTFVKASAPAARKRSWW